MKKSPPSSEAALNHAPIPFPAGSVDFDKWVEGTEKAVSASPEKYDEAVAKATDAALEVVYDAGTSSALPGHGMVERPLVADDADEDQVAAAPVELIQVFDPNPKDVVEPPVAPVSPQTATSVDTGDQA